MKKRNDSHLLYFFKVIKIDDDNDDGKRETVSIRDLETKFVAGEGYT